MAADPAKQIRRCKALKQRLESLRASVVSTETIVSATTSDELRRLLKEAQAKALAARFAATEAFKSETLPMVGSEVWKALWEAARKFSTEEAYTGAPFPHTDVGAVCVLCQQPLSPEAADRLARFEQFVKENAQKLAEAARGAVQQFKKQLHDGAAPKETIREAVRLLRDELALEPDKARRLRIENLARRQCRQCRRSLQAAGSSGVATSTSSVQAS